MGRRRRRHGTHASRADRGVLAASRRQGRGARRGGRLRPRGARASPGARAEDPRADREHRGPSRERQRRPMTAVADRPSLLKSVARSVLPRPARNWLRSPVESLHYPERRLLIRRAAAGASVGTARMVDAGIQSRGYFITAEGYRRTGDVTLVPAVTVDALAAEYGVSPTHLKIDVEGDEAGVLAGATRALRAHGARRPIVFLELHNEIIRARGDMPGRALDILTACGYRIEAPSGAPLSVHDAVRPAVTRLVALPRE